MKYLVTPEFSKKLAVVEASARAYVSHIIDKIGRLSATELANSNRYTWIQVLGPNIYALREGTLRILATVAGDDKEATLVLLDIVEHKQEASVGRMYAVNDPRTNPSFNPATNPRLNPQLNASVNPQLNASINPTLNASLNPRLNSSINPAFNASINPKFNSAINPSFNASLNPKFNLSINPKLNGAYGGPFLYDIKLNQSHFVVQANSEIILIFDMNANFAGYGVKNLAGGYTLFDTNNTWTGQLVSAETGVFLWFDLHNQRTGMMV